MSQPLCYGESTHEVKDFCFWHGVAHKNKKSRWKERCTVKIKP